MIFAYGDIPYTDERIEMADWPARKESVPSGKVPVLMIDEKPLPQSMAIARYAAKEAGLVPQDNLHAAYCDAVADTISDVMGEYFKIKFSSSSEEEKKKKIGEEFVPNNVNPILQRLNKRLTDKQWFVSDQTTWGDLIIGQAFDFLRQENPSLLKAFPNVEAHVEKVLNLPKIKEWISKRPKTAV